MAPALDQNPGCLPALGDPNQTPPLIIAMGGFILFAFHFICTMAMPRAQAGSLHAAVINK